MENRKQEEEQFLHHHLGAASDSLRSAIYWAMQFAQLMREKQVAALPGWLMGVKTTPGQTELQRFAMGLHADVAAVGAAIALPWSNGPVEGQVNRLKLIKRQMYGRGKC